MLSDRDINKALARRDIEIEGLVPGSIQPASVDFHLSDRPLKVWKHSGLVDLSEGMGGTYDGNTHAKPIVPWEDQSGEMYELSFYESMGRGWMVSLLPGQFALASTSERVRLGPAHLGRLEGKSSLARLGLIVHTTAGFFDPGFEGYPTLELLNVSPRPMLLRPNMPIAQMAFDLMSSPVETPYGQRGHYADQGADPVASRYFENFKAHPPVEHDGFVSRPPVLPTHSCEYCGDPVAHTIPGDRSNEAGWRHVTSNGKVLDRVCSIQTEGQPVTMAWPRGMAH